MDFAFDVNSAQYSPSRRYTGISSSVRFKSTTVIRPSFSNAVTSILSVYLVTPIRCAPAFRKCVKCHRCPRLRYSQCNGRYTLPSASGIPALICRRCSALHWSTCRPADSRGTGGYPASRRKLSPPHPAVAECIFPLFQKKSVQNSHPPLPRLLRNAPGKSQLSIGIRTR